MGDVNDEVKFYHSTSSARARWSPSVEVEVLLHGDLHVPGAALIFRLAPVFWWRANSRVKDLFCRWLPGVLRAPSPEDVAPRGRGGVEALRIAGGEAEVRARDPSIDAIPRIPSLPREHPLDIPFLGASRSRFSSANARRSPTHPQITSQGFAMEDDDGLAHDDPLLRSDAGGAATRPAGGRD